MTPFRRFVAEETSQDLVEYALLGSFFGLIVLGGFTSIENAISASYGTWDSGVQGLWEPADPAGSGS